LHGVVVESGGENDVGNFEFTFDEFLQDAEAVEAGHLDVEEDEVGRVFLDEVDGFEAIFALADERDFREGFEEESEFLASRLFVVNDDGVDGHWKRKVYSGRWPATSDSAKGKVENKNGKKKSNKNLTQRRPER